MIIDFELAPLSSEVLDKVGEMYGLPRNDGETDDEFRIRLMEFIKGLRR